MVFEEILDLLEGYAPEFSGGFSNHGPMAAEALVALGLGEEAPRWAARYRERLEPAPSPNAPIDVGAWRVNLGERRRYPDWEAFFAERLLATPWTGIVATWVARLLPGLSGAAAHGVIRTAHAVRMVEQAETPATLRELARGLAYWAASFERLPGQPTLRGGLEIDEAVESLPALPPELAEGRFIDDRLRVLAKVDAFPEVVDALIAPDDVDAALSDLTAEFAGAYLANAPHAPIEFVHTVTGPAAVRVLLPYLPAPLRHVAFGYAWQLSAGIHAACGHLPPVPEAEAPGVTWDEVAARALAGADEHAIKLVEACHREDSLRPDPRYLAAATDVVQRLGG